MTTNNFKKAIENEVKNYEYASAIMRLIRLDEFCASGTKCGSTNVALIAVQEYEITRKKYRVYYNYNTMKNNIGHMDFYTYGEACEEFAKFAV